MSPALKLFVDFCQNAPEAYNPPESTSSTTTPTKMSNISPLGGSKQKGNPWLGRFKLAVRCENINEFGLPGFIKSYNAKPLLIVQSGHLVR